MKARALRRELVTGLIAPVQTTRLTGGYDYQKKPDRKIRQANNYNIDFILTLKYV